MNDLTDIQTRFPALSDGWARFDGPAGTQVVDTAIEAMSDWQRSGRNANSHGAFPAAQACDDLVDETSKIMGGTSFCRSCGNDFWAEHNRQHDGVDESSSG